MDLKKEIDRAYEGIMGKLNGTDRFSTVCDIYNFIQFVHKYVPSYDNIKYDDDGYVIINEDMKSMSRVKLIMQQRDYQKYDTLVCTEVLNDMFKTNLDDLSLYAHSRMITDDILNTVGLTYSMIAEYESHPWYYHKWNSLKTCVHSMYLRVNILRLKIVIYIKKHFLGYK